MKLFTEMTKEEETALSEDVRVMMHALCERHGVVPPAYFVALGDDQFRVTTYTNLERSWISGLLDVLKGVFP